MLPSPERCRFVRLAALCLLGALAGCATPPPPPPPPPAPAETAAQCLARLELQHVAFEPVAQPVAAAGCGIANAVRVQQSAIAWNRPAVMSCGLAARLEAFEREVVQAEALRHLGQRIVRIEHLGAFECRRETSGRDRLSQHALGNAIDIAGFTLADGSVLRIAAEWRHGGARRDFLHAVARRACDYFSVVLTPASDTAHLDHFHLDIGRYRLCSIG